MYYFSMLFGLMICQIFSQGSNLNSIKLFVKLSSWAKGVHSLAPSSIRSFFQIQAHEFYDFFFTKSVLCVYISKRDVVRQCHLHNFTKFSFAVFKFHIFGCSLYIPCKLYLMQNNPSSNDSANNFCLITKCKCERTCKLWTYWNLF